MSVLIRSGSDALTQASLARTPGSAYAGTLLTFMIVGVIPLAAIRVVNLPMGVLSLIIFGVLGVNSLKVYPVHLLWSKVRCQALKEQYTTLQ